LPRSSRNYKPLEQNRVDLVFEITEGPVTGVAFDPIFIG